MKVSVEQYYPQVDHPAMIGFEPYISYEHWHRYRYAAVFVAGKAVLDVASGEGYGSHFLASVAADVSGVDISAEAVAHAAEKYVLPNLKYLTGSAEALPFEGEALFDVVVSFETIEHIDRAAQERFLKEVKRVLRPGGLFIVSTPDRAVYTEQAGGKNPYHIDEFDREEFGTFLKNHFAHTRLLGQRNFPASYIWAMDPPSGPLVEHQMALDEDAVFRPTDRDKKEPRYLVAVCSDDETQVAPPESLLLDLSETAFRGVPGVANVFQSTLYLDTGFGYRADELVRTAVRYDGAFAVEFDLGAGADAREVRWDPVEERLCRLKLTKVEFTTADGQTHAVDLAAVRTNGNGSPDEGVRFETIDPMVYLPVTGVTTAVRVEGVCEVLSAGNSAWVLDQQLIEHRYRLERAARELAEAKAGIDEAKAGIHERDRRLEGLAGNLAARDGQIDGLMAALAERDRQFTSLMAAVAERDHQFGALMAAAAERDHVLTELSSAVAGQGQAVEWFRDQFEKWNERHKHDSARLEELADHIGETAAAVGVMDAALSERQSRIALLERQNAEIRQTLREVIGSRRWAAANWVRSAVYFVPSRVFRLGRVAGR